MAGIKFDITGDNRNFLDSMKQVQDDVRKTSKIIESVGKNFDISSVDEKVVSLTKVIRQNEDVILKHQSTINKWKKDADAAFSEGNMSLFNTITKDIDAEAKKIQELVDETNKYRDALEMVNAMASNGTNTVSLPMLFNSEEEYRNVQRLTSGIAELRMKIATFDGSDAELQGLRSQLSGMQDELRQAQMSAAEAASALGDNGERAAETSQRYFQLSDAVSNQEAVVAELTNKLNAAASAMEQAKASGDTEAIDNATVKYDALADQVQNAKMELISMNAEFGKVKEEFQGDTTESLRMQLRKTTLELATLTLTYRQMTAEERNSAKGREMAAKLQELTQKAGDLRDTMQDVNTAIQATASDTKNFDAAAGGFNVLTSSIGAAVGTLSLFGVKEDELIEIQTKLQASLAISNALSVIQNNLQKESALMLAITNIQKKAEVIGENLVIAAKGRNIIVTKAATVAQAAFNVVAKANPYVLLATALISVVGALALFAKGTKEATEQEKLQQAALEREKDAVEKYQSALSNSYANLMTKYSDLRREWNNLANDHERTKWIKDNQNAFNELGLKVNNVTDAESSFRNNTQNVVDSFKRRAEAAALAAQMTEYYRQQMDLEQKFTDRYNQRKVRAGDRAYNTPGVISEDESGGTYEGGKYMLSQSSGYYVFTEKGAEEYNAELLKSDATLSQIKEEWKGVGEKIDEADKKLQKLGNTGKKVTTTTTSGGSGNDPRAFQRYNAMIQEYFKNRVRSAENLQTSTTQAEIDAMEDGNDKTMRQIQLDFEKRKTEIERAYEDLKQKKIDEARQLWEANPANNGKAFDESSVNTEYTEAEVKNHEKQLEALDKERERALKSQYQQEAQAFRDYLHEYGTFQEKKLALAEEYAEKIRKAQSNGERLSLQREFEAKKNEIDTNRLLENIDMASVFGDFGLLLSEPLKMTVEQLRKLTQTDAFKNRSFEEQKTVFDAIEKAEKSLSGLESLDFSGIGNAMVEYNAALSERVRLEGQLADAAQRLTEADGKLIKVRQSGDEAAIELAKHEYDEAEAKYNLLRNDYAAASTRVAESQAKATQSLTQFQSTLNKVDSSIRAIYNGSLKGIWDLLGHKLQSKIGGLVSGGLELQNQFDKMVTALTKSGIGIDAFADNLQSKLGEVFSSFTDETTLEDAKNAVNKMIGKVFDDTFGDDDKFDKVANKVGSLIGDLLESGAEKGTAKDTAQSIGQTIGELLKNVGKAGEASGNLWGAIIGIVLQLLDEFAERGLGRFVEELLTKVGNAVSGILGTIFQDLIPSLGRGIGQLVAGIIEGIVNLFSAGEAGSFLTGKDHDEEYNKGLENWEKSIEANTYAVEQLTKKMSDKTLTPQESEKERDAALSAVQGQIASLRGSANYVANDSSDNWFNGYHSWVYKRDSKRFNYKHFNYVLAEHGSTAKVGSAQDVLGLSAKDIQILRTYAGQAWADFFGDVGSKQNPNDVKKYLEQIGDLAEKDKEIMNEWYATLVNMSFDDLRNNFKSKMMDMKSDAKDFTNDFAKMMTDSLLDSFMATSGLNKAIEEWRSKWGKALGNDNTLDKTELDDLRKEYENLVKQAMEVRDQAAQITGYTDTDKYEQEASSKGFQAMSQDLGEELSGRFTAVQIAGENISAQMLVVVATMNSLASFSGSTNGAVLEIRNMMIMTNSYLENVVKYAKLLYMEFGEKLDDIVNNTKML